MRKWVSSSLALATALALAGCGGGGSSHVASTPVPPPPPPSAPAIIPAVTLSQQFTVEGASHHAPGDTPLLDDGDQLQVRYVQSSNSYEVQLPQSQSWIGIAYDPSAGSTPINFIGNGVHLWLRSDGYQYSRLIEWSGGNSIFGHEAIGMATPAGGVPVNGSATYAGQILGATSETHLNDDLSITGTVALAFNFGAGSLSGQIDPVLNVDFTPYALGTLTFTDTVYSTGSTTFAGKFLTNLAGVNSFNGLFTGPNAQELIGKLAFPYHSPLNGLTYQADGAFVAKK
jgi:hypothetical protein